MHTEKKYLFIEVFAYLRQMRIYLQCDFQKDQLNTHTEFFFYCQTCPWEQKTGFCAPCISDMFSNLTCSSHIKCWDIFFLFLSFFFFQDMLVFHSYASQQVIHSVLPEDRILPPAKSSHHFSFSRLHTEKWKSDGSEKGKLFPYIYEKFLFIFA